MSAAPGHLWSEASAEHPNDADARRARYRELMVEHGHLIPGKPEPLPCGWSPSQTSTGTAGGASCRACGGSVQALPEPCSSGGSCSHGCVDCGQHYPTLASDSSQTSASVDALPEERAPDVSAPCPAVHTDLAASAPDRAADVSSPGACT